ncbi:hypothetical protein LDENG_00211000 [Lucifuga dentata]|nr:hypothetical protein LDENG_00211000 [Lucifuga dentata]
MTTNGRKRDADFINFGYTEQKRFVSQCSHIRQRLRSTPLTQHSSHVTATPNGLTENPNEQEMSNMCSLGTAQGTPHLCLYVEATGLSSARMRIESSVRLPSVTQSRRPAAAGAAREEVQSGPGGA